MAERTTRENGAVSMTSPDGHLAPNDGFPNDTRRRSASIAPSLQSHITVVEGKDNSPDLYSFGRQQTFRSPLKLSFWDWVKGIFNREALMRRIERSMEITRPQGSSQKVFRRSDFLVTVLVSPKANSTQHHSTQCLLDTGCLRGNLVTRELVNRLGYVTSDFQTPTPYESEGARTLTGEPFAVEAAIYLSWHHSSSPITFRQMRFLIISNSEFEMIIGSDTISKHSLLVPPVFATGSRSVYEPSEDPTVREMRLDHAEAESEIENLERDLQKELKKPESERNQKLITSIKDGCQKKKAQLEIMVFGLDAQKAESKGKNEDAKRLREQAESAQDALDRKQTSPNRP